MAEGEKGTPAPTQGVDPAVLNPTRESSYDVARREKLRAFAAKVDEAPEAAVDAAVDVEADASTDAVPEPEAELVESENAEPATPDALLAAEAAEAEADPDAADPETPEAEAEVAEPVVEPAQPKPYRATDETGQEIELPSDLTFTYKADGAERTRSLDEVIKYAQLGENFDRRSRELAHQQREFQEGARQHAEQLNTQFQDAYQSMVGTIRRFFEDEEYREEALDEWYRITSDPEQLKLRIAAQQGEQAQRELQTYRQQQQQDFERKVWQTVDTIIGERLADYDPELRGGLAERIKDRFRADFSARGQEVLSENYLVQLILDERSIIDQAVARARAEAERSVAPQLAQAKAQAVATKQNQATDRALQRQKVVRAAPKTTNAPSPQAARPQIKSMQDARKALDKWANG